MRARAVVLAAAGGGLVLIGASWGWSNMSHSALPPVSSVRTPAPPAASPGAGADSASTVARSSPTTNGATDRAPTRVPSSQQLARLLSNHEAFAAPGTGAPRLAELQSFRPLTGERTELPVVASRQAGGIDWLRVRLPGRPNGRLGWIERRSTVLSTTKWHIVVETAQRRVLVYRAGKIVRSVQAVLGAPSTPTPLGQYFVEEDVQLAPSDVGAPFALALSARSDVFQEFDGGPGQVALHGLDNVGGILGTAVSHGCVRLADAVMSWLVLRIGPGVPVTITN